MKRTKIIIICIVLLSTPIWAQRAQNGERSPVFSLFSKATPGKAGRIVTVGGRLSPKLKVNHTVSVAGYIESILVEVGDKVVEGQPLVRVTRNVAGETFLPVIIESRINGIVSEINIFEKQEVSVGTSAITILDNSSFKLETSLSDRDTRAIRELGNIGIVGSTTDGKAFNGKILYISQEPDYDTGLFTLNMEFKYTEGLYLGMVLFVDIEAQKPEGLTISKPSLFRENGKTYIWKLSKDNKLSMSEITIESESKSGVIISSGLKSGESYLTEITGNEKDGMDPKELLVKADA